MNKFILFLLIVLAIPIVSGLPTINTYTNDISNDTSLSPVVQEGQEINFSVLTYTSVDGPDYYWYRDGVVISNNFPDYTTSWTRWGDNAEIVVYIVDSDGNSSNLTWNPVIILIRATGTPEQINLTRANEFKAGVQNFDLEEMLAAEMGMYTDQMGSLFFLLIIGVPFVMIWLRTESLIIPSALGVVLGGILILFMPPVYQTTIIIILVISITGILLGIYKDRR